jgi:hypothetical protein
MHDSFGVHYMNCGDWVESCTALVENSDGQFDIIYYPRVAALMQRAENDTDTVDEADGMDEIGMPDPKVALMPGARV